MEENTVFIQEQLKPLFDPRAVAVIGASNNWNKWGFTSYMSLLDGFQGRVYPVNSREERVMGRPTFKRVTDIPEDEPVDLAVIVIPAESVPAIMEDCVLKGVRAAVIIAAGFAETGKEGKELQDRVLEIARRGNIRFIGPNCMGYWSATSNLKAFMFPLPVREGPFAFVSQGGNIGAIVVQSAYFVGMGFRRYISCGCTADIQIEDYIEHFGNDPDVKVILAYIEGLNDGQRFIEKVRPVAMKKPVIALKPGKTEAGTRAILSHSGALAGSSEIYDSAFREAGVIRVSTANELLDVAIGFETQPLPKGRNVAIITPGGSYGVMSADACASIGLNVPTLSDATIADLDRIFPPRWSHGNPVDPAGDRDFIAYMKAPELLLKLPEVDSLIFMGFDSFSYFANVFGSMSGEFAQTLKNQILSLSEKGPGHGAADRGDPISKMGKVMEKVIEDFFALVGTSARTEGRQFAQKILAILKTVQLNPKFIEKMRNVMRSYYQKTDIDLPGFFQDVFEPMIQALVVSWIKSYGKPVLTTTFLGSAKYEASLGYHAYPSTEAAAAVLEKLVEYQELIKRKSEKSFTS